MNDEFVIDIPLESGELVPIKVHWPPNLCRDIAIEDDVVPIADIIARHEVSPEEYEALLNLPSFRRELSEWRRKVLDEGYSFKVKMQALCDTFVTELYLLGTSPTVAPNVRLDAIKTAAKLAHYEPKDNLSTNNSNIPQVNIQINL